MTASPAGWAGQPVTLHLDGKEILLQQCGLYLHYSAVLNSHHVCPESWWQAAGKPVASPLLELCPTCHMNTHAAIDGLIRGLDVSRLPRRCVKLARLALALAAEAGLTPAPTL